MAGRSIVILVCCLLLVPACGRGDDRPERPTTAPPLSTAAPAVSDPAARGDLYLDRDECVRVVGKGDRAGYPEVPCGDAAAVAKVLSRYPNEKRVPALSSSQCHEDTDLLVDLEQSLQNLGAAASDDENGYACLRNLRAPHPSDPGRGGGVVREGDCVTAAKTKISDIYERLTLGGEVPCSKRGDLTYRVVAIVTVPRYKEPDCPAGSSAFSPVSLLGTMPDATETVETYCAKPR